MVVGHQKQIEFLEAARVGGGLSHAYIFAGPKKIGKKSAALEWLEKFLNVSLNEKTAHPDFLFLAPLADEKTGKIAQEITVGQIRGLIAKLALSPVFGKHKAAIIDQAHLMNIEAQNCLLKTLEEPPAGSLIVLIVDNEDRLLETIRSRCQISRFNFLSLPEMEKFGADFCAKNDLKIEKSKIKEIAGLSLGRPGRLANFLADAAALENWQSKIKEFSQIVKAELPEKFAYVKKIVDDETADIGEYLEIWQIHFRNLLLESLAGDLLRGLDPRKPQEEQSGQKFAFSKLKEKEKQKSPQEIAAILKKIQDLDLVLQISNAGPRLSMESLMLEL
jgi:DNA polymerase-3 subunit delta'